MTSQKAGAALPKQCQFPTDTGLPMDWGWLVFVLLVAFVVRITFLASGGVIIEADEAIVGLMAKHISEGATWPIFFYGQPYMGSLESILTAPVFLLIGMTHASLKTVPLIFSLLFIVLIYRLTIRVSDRLGARIATVLAACPPVAFVEWSCKARGGFIELVVLGTLALILAVDITRCAGLCRSRIATLGLVLGLAWWVNNQAIFYMGAIGLVLLLDIARKYRFKGVVIAGVVGFASFFIGSAPFWYYNFTSDPKFATFLMLGDPVSWGTTLKYLKGVFTEALPILCGGRKFWTDTDLFCWSGVLSELVYGLVIALGIYLASKEKGTEGKNRGYGLLLLLIGVSVIVFSKSSFGWLSKAPRYLLPLYSSLFPLVGLSLSIMTRKLRFQGPLISAVLFSTIFGFHLASNYRGGLTIPGQPFVAYNQRVALDHSELIHWLNKHRYTQVHTNYWIGYRLAYETAEHVTFSVYREPRSIRLPHYEATVQGIELEVPYVVVPREGEKLRRELAEQGYSFRVSRASGYEIIDLITPPRILGAPLHVNPEDITVSSRDDWKKYLVDGDMGTRWGSGAPQRPGMSITVNFKAPTVVAGIRLETGFWPQDVAPTVTFLAELESGEKCTLYDGPSGRIVDGNDLGETFYFEPRSVRRITIIEQGTHPILDWSVAEIDVFGPEAIENESPAALK